MASLSSQVRGLHTDQVSARKRLFRARSPPRTESEVLAGGLSGPLPQPRAEKLVSKLTNSTDDVHVQRARTNRAQTARHFYLVPACV